LNTFFGWLFKKNYRNLSDLVSLGVLLLLVRLIDFGPVRENIYLLIPVLVVLFVLVRVLETITAKFLGDQNKKLEYSTFAFSVLGIVVVTSLLRF
jgi:formate hydrogenlyase subunit 4